MNPHRNSRLALVAGGVCLGLGASIVRFGQLPSLVAPTVVGAMMLIALVRALAGHDDDEARARLQRWTLASLGVHLVLGVIVTASSTAAHYLGADAASYHQNALRLLAHWQHGLPMPSLPRGREGFYYLLAGIYRVFGPYKWAGLVVNATLSAALVPIIWDTTRRLFGHRAAYFVPPLVVLVPGLILWGSQLLKEASVLFLLAVAANCGVRLVSRVTPGPLLVLMATLPALLAFRGHVGAAAIGGIVLGMAVGKRDLAGGTAAAMSVVGVVALALALGLGSSGYDATVNADLRQADNVRRGLSSTANSGFDTTADVSTPGAALSYLPRGLLGFVGGPYPWQLVGTRQLIAVPDVAAWYFLMIPMLWLGWRAGRRTAGRRPLVLILPALTITVMLSLLIGNYGTIVRERMQILVLLVPLIALGLAERRARSSSGTTTPVQSAPVQLVP